MKRADELVSEIPEMHAYEDLSQNVIHGDVNLHIRLALKATPNTVNLQVRAMISHDLDTLCDRLEGL